VYYWLCRTRRTIEAHSPIIFKSFKPAMTDKYAIKFSKRKGSRGEVPIGTVLLEIGRGQATLTYFGADGTSHPMAVGTKGSMTTYPEQIHLAASEWDYFDSVELFACKTLVLRVRSGEIRYREEIKSREEEDDCELKYPANITSE
jgi:hypothetical protein